MMNSNNKKKTNILDDKIVVSKANIKEINKDETRKESTPRKEDLKQQVITIEDDEDSTKKVT